jgi:hypothetical protein
VDGLTANVTTHVAKNEKGRFRISGIDVELLPDMGEADSSRIARCEGLFEDFCIVTESVRQGIPVNVRIDRPAVAEV